MADPQPTDPAAPPVPKPAGLWGMILTATPVALTALATAFAGLSSSEMTQAMYHRSLAAQHQSRAGNQWAFFQAKRIRGNGIESSVEVLQALGHPEPFLADTVAADLDRMTAKLHEGIKPVSPVKDGDDIVVERVHRTKPLLVQFAAADMNPPGIKPQLLPDPAARQAFQEAVDAIARRRSETETTGLIARLSPTTIDEAIQLAEDDADRFDQAWEPVGDTLGRLKGLFNALGNVIRTHRRDNATTAEAVALFDRLDASFRVAVLKLEANRYRQEAAFNRRAAEAYEVRVRRSGIESDRHRERSKQFFYSMLLAQVGVTVSSLALAKATRSWLWFFAALVAVVSLGFTGYVYLSY